MSIIKLARGPVTGITIKNSCNYGRNNTSKANKANQRQMSGATRRRHAASISTYISLREGAERAEINGQCNQESFQAVMKSKYAGNSMTF